MQTNAKRRNNEREQKQYKASRRSKIEEAKKNEEKV